MKSRYQKSVYNGTLPADQTLTISIETKFTWKNLWKMLRYGSLKDEFFVDIGKILVADGGKPSVNIRIRQWTMLADGAYLNQSK